MKLKWNYPTTMWVGENRVKDLGIACKNLNINKPLIVTDRGLAKSNIVIDVLKNLKEEGFLVELYSNVVGNPTGSNVNEGVSLYKKNNCDGVIAFGGGSGLDVGKAIAFMSGQTLPIWDFEDVGDNWTKANSDKIAPIIAVPTTAGTGSETGRASVILNEETGVKNIIFFMPVTSFNITEALPVSDPVPAVVGTAIIGAILSEFALVQLSPTSSKSQIGKVWPDINAIALPTSKPLPPPKAITPSQLFLL